MMIILIRNSSKAATNSNSSKNTRTLSKSGHPITPLSMIVLIEEIKDKRDKGSAAAMVNLYFPIKHLIDITKSNRKLAEITNLGT
jgi:hypothetical protein